MKRAWVLWPIMLALLMGCDTPAKRLLAARETYNATMTELTALRSAGMILDAEAQTIEVIRQQAWAALDQWQGALDAGLPADSWIALYNSLVNRLIQIKLEAANRGG